MKVYRYYKKQFKIALAAVVGASLLLGLGFLLIFLAGKDFAAKKAQLISGCVLVIGSSIGLMLAYPKLFGYFLIRTVRTETEIVITIAKAAYRLPAPTAVRGDCILYGEREFDLTSVRDASLLARLFREGLLPGASDE